MPGTVHINDFDKKVSEMVYDPEKYRNKREKVLGIKKRGLGFGTLAVIVSAVIIAGLSVVTVPQAVSYMNTRNLDDAILKLESASSWPKGLLVRINAIQGVKFITNDKNHARLVVTYDRREPAFKSLQALFEKQGLQVTVLNQVNHRQHQTTLRQEEESEAP